MNWFQRLAQAKPMALPQNPPSDIDWGTTRGIQRIDDRMTDETALQEYDPDMEWGGAGSFGVVYLTGPDEMTKYTYDEGEVKNALEAYRNQYDFVVPILEEPQQIQQNPPMWKIRMRELRRFFYPSDEYMMYGFIEEYFQHHGGMPDKDDFIEGWVTDEADADKIYLADRVYEAASYLLTSNADTLRVTDTHGGNVGWDSDGKLKIFDLGKENSTAKS